jgi:hypothetical protein
MESLPFILSVVISLLSAGIAWGVLSTQVKEYRREQDATSIERKREQDNLAADHRRELTEMKQRMEMMVAEKHCKDKHENIGTVLLEMKGQLREIMSVLMKLNEK